MRLVAASLGMVLGSPRVRNGAGRAQAVEHLLLASVSAPGLAVANAEIEICAGCGRESAP
jgi:hypothetical protein